MEDINNQWVETADDLPARGQKVWTYDGLFVKSTIITFDPTRIGDLFSHWMPRETNLKPGPPAN